MQKPEEHITTDILLLSSPLKGIRALLSCVGTGEAQNEPGTLLDLGEGRKEGSTNQWEGLVQNMPGNDLPFWLRHSNRDYNVLFCLKWLINEQ